MKTFKQFLFESDDFEVTHQGWHGTPDSRGIRKEGFKTRRQQFGISNDKPVYWATQDHGVAKTYANPHRSMDYRNAEPEVLPVEMQMKNPKVIHWKGRKFRGRDNKTGERFDIADDIEQARSDGHDGFVIHGVKDAYDAKGKASTIMGVFNNKHIRIKK